MIKTLEANLETFRRDCEKIIRLKGHDCGMSEVIEQLEKIIEELRNGR